MASSTGTGAGVFQTSPTITTPVISSLSSASATALTLQSAGTTAITVDTSQNVTIAQAIKLAYGASTQYAVDGAISNYASNNNVYINGNASGGLRLSGDGSGYTNITMYGQTYGGTPNITAFNTNNSERMRIDSSGNLLVQTTSASFNSGVGMKMIPDASGPAIVCVGTATTASFNSYFIYSTGAGANRFYVSYAGQIYATSTGITAISDVTLKENIRDLETGLNEVMALKPRRFDWKEETKLDQKNVAGFIAQEVEPVLPDLVYDYKYNEETTKKAVKMSDMLPTLVKAIQELKAINDQQAETINALTARIEALENR
jgi:hypothetical protein